MKNLLGGRLVLTQIDGEYEYEGVSRMDLQMMAQFFFEF